VDTKKELAGNYRNAGREWRPPAIRFISGIPISLSRNWAKEIPYTIYDLAADATTGKATGTIPCAQSLHPRRIAQLAAALVIPYQAQRESQPAYRPRRPGNPPGRRGYPARTAPHREALVTVILQHLAAPRTVLAELVGVSAADSELPRHACASWRPHQRGETDCLIQTAGHQISD